MRGGLARALFLKTVRKRLVVATIATDTRLTISFVNYTKWFNRSVTVFISNFYLSLFLFFFFLWVGTVSLFLCRVINHSPPFFHCIR